MNVQSVLSGIFIRYGLTQAILLPLMMFSWFIIPKRASLRFQWVLHRVIFVVTIVLPMLLSLPGASSIAHAIGDQAVRAPAAEPASTASPAAQPDPATLPSPALPAHNPKSVEEAPVAVIPMASRPIFTFTEVLDRLPAALGAFSLLGLLGFLALIGRQAARERRIRSASSRNQRIGKINIVASNLVRSPFSTGLLRPRIYLPNSIARSSVRRRMVLSHEAIHVRNMHIAWMFVERFHAALFWYNPLAHLLATNGSRLRELRCDRGAGRIHGDVAYCRVLLDAAESLDGTHASHVLANAWIGRRFLRRRIEFIALRLGMTSRRWVFAAAPIAALVCVVIFVSCAPRILPREATQTEALTSPRVSTLMNLTAEWPDSTITLEDGHTLAYRDVVTDTAVTGWNMGTGRMYNLWAGPERTHVLGVENPEGFWLRIERGEGVPAAAFNDDLHALVSGILLHLPFLQRIWAGLLSAQPGLQGETGVVLSVDSHGAVRRAEPDSAKPGDRTLADAFVKSMKSWKLTTRDVATDYIIRIPITSKVRADSGHQLLELGLGDQVAEVPANAMSSASMNAIGGSDLQETWYRANQFVAEDVGISIISITLASDGTVQSARLLDTDLSDPSRVSTLMREIAGWHPHAAPGKEVGIVLVHGWVPGATGNVTFWHDINRFFAIGTDAVRYFDTVYGGYSRRVNLSLTSELGDSIRGIVTGSMIRP